MKKVLAIVAFVAAMFVAGNVQAQSTIYAGYAPENFVYSNSTDNYQGFFAGFTQLLGLVDLVLQLGELVTLRRRFDIGQITHLLNSLFSVPCG